MGEPRLESYPWYLDDWFRSETRASMTLAERGLYRELIDLCWASGSLPTDRNLLRTMTQVDVKSFRSCIEVALKPFVEIDGRFHHPKVDEKRKELIAHKLERSESGRKGGLAKSSAKAQLKLSSSSRARSPSPSPTTSTLSTQESLDIHKKQSENNTIAPNEKPKQVFPLGYSVDEQYAKFRELYREWGANVIEADFLNGKIGAWPAWVILDGLQRQKRIDSLAVHVRETDAAYAPKPKAFIETEWERPPRRRPKRKHIDIMEGI